MAVAVGVVVPLTFNDAWSTADPGGENAHLMAIPFGPVPDQDMLMNMMVFFTLPCGLVVTFCHIYVYSVANRHAKAIKRDDGARDRMKMSASYKMATTTATEAAAVIGVEAATSGNGNYLSIPLGGINR